MSGISVGNGLSKGVGLSVGSGFSRGGGLYFSGFSVAPTLNLDFTTMTALPSTITFSRPSNATYYDSTGKLTYAPNNLLLRSEDGQAAAWSKNNVTATSNTTDVLDPLGGSTATKLVSTAAADNSFYQQVTQSYSVGQRWVFSFYARTLSGTATIPVIGDDANGNFWCNPGSNAVSITSSWTRFSVTGTSPSAAFSYIRAGLGGYNTWTTANTIYVWGLQLERVTYQTTPGTYNATTSAAYYGARLDYNPATLAARGLLIEEARTNLALYSDQFNNAAWGLSLVTVTTNSTTSPDGTVNAETITANAGGGAHAVYSTSNIASSASTNYAQSIFVKKGTYRFIYVAQSIGGNLGWATAIFDLDGGSSSATQTQVGGITPGVITSTQQENIGNGWFRLTLVASTTLTARYFTFGFASAATGNSFDAQGNVTFTATGAETFYVWGAQYELGSFATSYIPTAASSVARSADTASMTGTNFSSWYNQSEGTFVPQYDIEGFATNPGVFRASNAGATNYSQTRLTSTTSVGDVVVSSSQASFSFGGAIINALQKFALAYRVNDFAGTLNGATPLTDTSGSAPTDLDRLFLADVGSNVAPLNGHLASFVYYPSRLSDGQLQQLTLSAPPVGNALVWGAGNYLVWGDGNFLTWG